MFLSAQELRNKKIYDVNLLDEVCAIKRAILIANAECNMSICIDTSPMTTPETELAEKAWKVWKGQLDDPFLNLQMEAVIREFESLGYTIARFTNCETGNTFKWCVSW